MIQSYKDSIRIHVSSNIFFFSFTFEIFWQSVPFFIASAPCRSHACMHERTHTRKKDYSPFPLLTAEVFPEEVRGSRLLRKSLSRLEQRHLWSQCLLISHVIDICPRGKSDAVRTETTINWLTDWQVSCNCDIYFENSHFTLLIRHTFQKSEKILKDCDFINNALKWKITNYQRIFRIDFSSFLRKITLFLNESQGRWSLMRKEIRCSPNRNNHQLTDWLTDRSAATVTSILKTLRGSGAPSFSEKSPRFQMIVRGDRA